MTEQGVEGIHGSTILNGWRTKDKDFCSYADKHDLVVITKDNDFRNSHFLQNTPVKLIKINPGNISNDELISIISAHITSFKKVFDAHSVHISKSIKTPGKF